MLCAAEVSHFSLLIKKSIFSGISSLAQGWQTDGAEGAKLLSQPEATARVMHYIQFTLCVPLVAMGTCTQIGLGIWPYVTPELLRKHHSTQLTGHGSHILTCYHGIYTLVFLKVPALGVM